MTEIKEYSEQGKLIYHRTCSGHECWYEYDDHGNITYFKDSNGFEEWNKYDEDGKRIHHDEAITKFDKKGNPINVRYLDGTEFKTGRNGNLYIKHKGVTKKCTDSKAKISDTLKILERLEDFL